MVARRLRERLPDGITRATRILVWTTLVENQKHKTITLY